MPTVLSATVPPLTEQATDLDRIWDGYLVIGFGVGALVAVLVTWSVIRYRRRSDDLPSQRQYHIPLELAYTIIPLLIVAGLFAVTFQSIHKVDDTSGPVDLVVEVTAFQWQWQFDYPKARARSVGAGDQRAELVLPEGARVRFDVTSRDVIHSFWIPGFRFKRDAIPGQTTSFVVTMTHQTGNYPDSGVCAEFCGVDHARMRFDVRIVTAAEFERWAAAHPTKGSR